MLEGIQIIGRDFRYLHLNEAAARHGRSTRAALLGRTMMECYPGVEKSPLVAMLHDCLERGTARVVENAFTYPDGSVGWFELRIEPVPQGVCVLSIDITARKQAEQAHALAEERLRQSQRMEAVGKLAAGVAHDFNNLLTVIVGQGELALERPSGPTREDVETLLAAARSSADLTRQLLAFGRQSVQKREVLDPAAVLCGVERILRAAMGTGIELHLDAPAGLGRVEVDRSQLEQVLMNLVVNARDAIEGEGRVSVSLSAVQLDLEYAAAHPGANPGPHLALTVSDTGAGMDAATRERIFEPFFTTKERGRGTGLGLATVYGIVKQHGGHLWVYSEPGKGSTFKVYLPVSLAEPPRDAVVTAAGSARGTVLVADDDGLLCRLVDRVLTGVGYEVLLARDGEEALRLWHHHADRIALLITDVTMPGIPGPELIRRMRVDRPELPVICTSGYSSPELGRRGSLPEGVLFVEKPFSPKLLRERVHELLSGK